MIQGCYKYPQPQGRQASRSRICTYWVGDAHDKGFVLPTQIPSSGYFRIQTGRNAHYGTLGPAQHIPGPLYLGLLLCRSTITPVLCVIYYTRSSKPCLLPSGAMGPARKGKQSDWKHQFLPYLKHSPGGAGALYITCLLGLSRE